MEFIEPNYINTTTQISVTNNTALISNIFNRDPYLQFATDGLDNDLTTGSITITFDATTPISRIALVDTNLKDFTIFYNGTTASTFTLDSTADTTTSSWTGNTNANLYLRFATVACSSITIDMKKTQTADQEKYFGLFHASDIIYTMDRIPSAGDYKPKLVPKQTVHTLSDGGTRIHNIRQKWNLNISFDYLDETARNSLRSLYDRHNPFCFCPFGTSTSWDGIFFESVWAGPFAFYEYSDNALASGFSGEIRMMETPF